MIAEGARLVGIVQDGQPGGAGEVPGLKVSLASIPQAGRKSLLTCFCKASTTGRISPSLSTVLALITEILLVADCGMAFSLVK